jgi:hypothetical protein
MQLSNDSSIPKQTISLRLRSAEPTKLTAKKLKDQLTAIGLTCEDSSEDNLEKYIADVRSQLHGGSTQSLRIFKPTGFEASKNGMIPSENDTAVGNWIPDFFFGYQAELEYIQYKPHFDWLYDNRPAFTGRRNSPPQYSGRESSVEAIKKQFVEVSYTASSVIPTGLDIATTEAVLTNVIQPLSDKNASDYDPGLASIAIFLVHNYSDVNKTADGLGVVTVDWDLKVKDFKKKKTALEHNWTLSVHARAVLYGSIEAMYADYNAVRAQFKGSMSGNTVLRGIPSAVTVEVFQSMPLANQETFVKSLPLVSTAEYVEVIVLYGAELQAVGSIDNSRSAATATWEKSVTSGFTFSTTQSLSVKGSLEASIEVVKAGISVTLAVSFTEEMSKSSTETISFTVPPGQLAFTYQGYMMAAVLRYDPGTNNYKYTDKARFVTSVIATSSTPILAIET